jgi:hypothetical protein
MADRILDAAAKSTPQDENPSTIFSENQKDTRITGFASQTQVEPTLKWAWKIASIFGGRYEAENAKLPD